MSKIILKNVTFEIEVESLEFEETESGLQMPTKEQIQDIFANGNIKFETKPPTKEQGERRQ